MLANIHDPLAQLEKIGLAASNPQFRLADIFCSGSTGLVALNNNMSSLFAQTAGDECCETSFHICLNTSS